MRPAPKALVACAALFVAASALTLLHGSASSQGKTREELPPYHSPQPISEPRLFSDNQLSSADFESHPCFTDGGHTVYFVKSTPTFGFWTIVYSRWASGGWTIPRTATFSGEYSDADPFITQDGKRVYFISNRPNDEGDVPRDNLDIWTATRTGDTTWSAPQHLAAPVNGPGNEWFPTLASDGTMYFGSDRDGGKGKTDLWRCRAAGTGFAPAENLGDSINTAANEFEPWIAPDQSYLLFMAGGRKDSRGGWDLYVSYPRSSGWSTPINLGDRINSKANEYSPHVSPDGEYFFWTSCRSAFDAPLERPLQYPELLAKLRRTRNGLGDIYQIDLKELHLQR